MLSPQSDLKAALDRCRTKLRSHPVGTAVVSTSSGNNPTGEDSPEGIVVLYSTEAPDEVVQTIQKLALEAAGAVPVYLFPCDPPHPVGSSKRLA